MGRAVAPDARDHGSEALARRDRAIALASLAAVVALAWLYLWRSAAQMDHGAMAMQGMPRGVDAASLALTFAMWVVMMAGMMLPSAAPAIVLYGTVVRRNGARGTALPGTWVFALGYLLAWAAFSVGATLLQALLEHLSLLTPGLASASATAGALALVGAGAYQLTPLKNACLTACRNPLEFFVTHWRDGAGGALRMGFEHGAYCVGCCWALMLLLFVAGVMNLVWVALIAAFVLVEKLLPGARAVSLVSGAALIGTGTYLLIVG